MSWIGPAEGVVAQPGERPAPLLRGEFDVEGKVVRAELRVTAHGLYEAFLNGARVGAEELTPGFTQYDARLQVQTYDVTALVRPGRNVLGAILADGWFRGQVGITRASNQWGDQTALLAQLVLTSPNGTETVAGTGSHWRSTPGHVLAADLIAGERWDLRKLPRGWSDPGFDDRDWSPVEARTGSGPPGQPLRELGPAQGAHAAPGAAAALVDPPAPPVRRVQELRPVSVTRLDAYRQVVDLGQNINGWTRLSRLGPAGTTVRLVHGEWLDAGGDVTTEHLRPAVPFLPEPLPAGQVDEVTSAGIAGDVFEPRRTTHGFRYVRVEGHPDDLTPDDVTGVVVHTDLRRTGWFSCSDERLNALHEAAVWSFRGNACDLPTDCPHRERAGWTGDWQLFVPTATFLYDVAGFSTKWLRDVAADQWPDGTVANISPTAPSEGRDSPIAFLNGSAGWEDAIAIVPWELYRAYGDTEILAELWPAMVAWLARVERVAREGRHVDRVAARPEPAAHERYLRDTSFSWGEWLVPGEDLSDFDAFVAADKGDVATAYYAFSADLLARIAGVLGRRPEAHRYRDLAFGVRDAWQREYVDPSGRLTPDTQANHVRALAFGLVPDDLRPRVAARLVELVRAAGTHVATGFLATPYLLPALADSGNLGVAYELLLADTEPSWLTMLARGATTPWERWNGVSADGVPSESLNHYSRGAVVSFLHRYAAGLELLEPGYRRFQVRPRPGGGLTWAVAAHDCPYGRIEVSWQLTGATFHLRVSVPPGTSADVVLPDGSAAELAPGRHKLRSRVS